MTKDIIEKTLASGDHISDARNAGAITLIFMAVLASPLLFSSPYLQIALNKFAPMFVALIAFPIMILLGNGIYHGGVWLKKKYKHSNLTK